MRGVINVADYNWNGKVTFAEYRRARIIGWHARLAGISPALVKVPKMPKPRHQPRRVATRPSIAPPAPYQPPRVAQRGYRNNWSFSFGDYLRAHYHLRWTLF